MTPAVNIGIQGPQNLTANMMSGGLYVLIAELPSARFPLLAGSLGSALKGSQVCNVIVPANPELFIRRIESFDCFNAPELLATQQLNFFVMQDEFPKKMFRFGATSFVKELEQYEITENSYLLFDQADELLSLHDISLALDQIDILRKWFERRNVTALLVFSRSTAEHSGTINALMDHLNGIARLSGDRDGLEITFDYWQSPEGTITARNYPLLTLDSGLYETTTRIVLTKPVAEEEKYERGTDSEDGEPRYFYMDSDLDDLTKMMPGIWQRVDTPIGMMHATRNKRSASCILGFDGDSDLQQLAETVHSLRVSLGRYAHIIVREKEASLGNQSEALLLRLGINLVVHRDVPISRLPTLLESLNGQIFKRDIEVNFETAVESAFPPKQRNYLPAQAFVREVNEALDQAETLGQPCAMVTGRPMPGLTVVEILTNNHLTRFGDMMSADGESCYIFINACPQTEILETLETILGMSVDEAFDDPKLFIHRDEIQPELAALMLASLRGNTAGDSSRPGINATQVQASSEHFHGNSHLAVTGIQEKSVPSFRPAHPLHPAASARLVEPQQRPKQSSLLIQADPASPQVGASQGTALTMETVSSSIIANLPSEEPLFSYDGASNSAAFGKKEAPRAIRNVSK